MKQSVPEILMEKHLRELKIPFEREYRFHPVRRWRFDFALCTAVNGVPTSYAIEIEGGSWIAGRHNRGKGFEADLRKYNEAAKMGWTVLRFTSNMIERGESKAFLAAFFKIHRKE